MVKKKNTLSKLWLKFTNKKEYKEYKWLIQTQKSKDFILGFIEDKRLTDLYKIQEFINQKQYINFIHSGNAGDIIYALPTLKKLYELTETKINFYLRLNQPLKMSGFTSHPLGEVMMNEAMANMLIPLINSQEYINVCEPFNHQEIHVDLDFFRAGLIPLDKSNIARWCGYVTGINPELYKSWLTVKPDYSFSDTIILARSERYTNPSIDFSFLNNYKNLKFVGVASEYKTMKKFIPNLEWLQVSDFLHLAQVIAGCKFFIGNQSFPFSIAEGLKTPRILEVYYEIANVIPEGNNAYDFIFQEHFEWLVNNLNQK
ncbi:hypothetical protein [Pedobacter glucosidilyticus]|uniref:hypothetical protein n=1 Tax=Pedobacter glucosidilyticus TaxID=1122941 RepID=UPI0026EC7C98|nr:hypothetical protein [Pedobacter glucosidilyticus]